MKNTNTNTNNISLLTSNNQKVKFNYSQDLISLIKVLNAPSDDNPNIYFNYLNKIGEWINHKDVSLYEIQSHIERDWVNIAKESINNKNVMNNQMLKAFKKVGRTLDSLNYFKRTRNVISILQENFDKQKLDYLLITYSLIIIYFDKLGYIGIANKIGKSIMFEFYKNKSKEYVRNNVKSDNNNVNILNNEVNNGKFPRFNEFLKENHIDNIQVIALGDFFIELFLINEIFDKTFVVNKYKYNDPTRLIINSRYVKYIKDNLIITPLSLPMIVQPIAWSDDQIGGYIHNNLLGEEVYSIDSTNKHLLSNKTSLYNVINYLNSIEFKINSDLLNFLMNEGSILFNRDILSKSEYLQIALTLKIAHTYKNNIIYLNTHADWRGRVYTSSFFLSYQGNDLSSSLLQFNNGEILTNKGKEYLYIYGANLHNQNNISKQPYSDRINWVKNNYEKIINLDIGFIQQAESPFLFSAFCLVLKNLDKDPNYKVHLPIFLDATCSGIQHLAGLLRDSDLADKVNLGMQLPTDKVADIYSDILVDINKSINQFGFDNPEFSNLSDIKLTRKIVKAPIMTKVYNVSIKGITEQLIGNLIIKEIDNKKYYLTPGKFKDHLLSYKDVFQIATIIYNLIFTLYPSLNNVYTYFIDIAKLMMKLNIPLIWTTPTGLEIKQHYLKSKINKLSIKIGNKSRTLVLREFYDKIDSRKQAQAIIPNVIHSLDAAHLIKIINYGIDNNIQPILTIHDCFGTHPNLFAKLEEIVKTQFIVLYIQNDFLTQFHSTIINYIKDNNYIIDTDNEDGFDYVIIHKSESKIIKYPIPILPKMGDLNLDDIMKSQYMIT